MTLAEFHELATHMGATVAFSTSSTAVFQSDDKAVTVTVEVSRDTLSSLSPVNAASLLADAAFMSNKFTKKLN